MSRHVIGWAAHQQRTSALSGFLFFSPGRSARPTPPADSGIQCDVDDEACIHRVSLMTPSLVCSRPGEHQWRWRREMCLHQEHVRNK